MKMQKLFENWNRFKADVLQEDLLAEASEHFVDYVERYLDGIGGLENLPFNDLFDSQSRVALPLGTAMQPGSTMAAILVWLEQQGYSTDFKTGLASKEFKSYTGKPGAPGTKEVMRTKQQKIGKVLQRAQDIQKKINDAQTLQSQARTDWHEAHRGADEDERVGSEELHDDPSFKRHMETARKGREDYAKHFRSDIYLGRIQSFVEYWNKNSRYYRENPEEMMVDYSVVVTRHPIDVLNMSDLGQIESCHSEGHDYHHCALKEAVSGGALAYLVETADLDSVDLDDDEIFEDVKHGRDVRGIEPLGRLRLRHFQKTGTRTSDNKYSLLIPEKREYGTSIPGFYEAVKEWAVESQKDKWSEALKDDGGDLQIDPEYLRDFVYMGGQYKDTPPRHMFMHAFADYGGKKFEDAEGGGWGDNQEEEERLARGIEHYVEQMNDIVYELGADAGRLDTVKEDGLYVTDINFEVVNPQRYQGLDAGDVEWNDNDTFEAAESENDPSYGPFPEVAFEATATIRVMLNGAKSADFPSADGRWSHDIRAQHEALENEIRTALDFNASEFLGYYEMEQDTVEDYLEFRLQFEGMTAGADRYEGGQHAPNHTYEFEEFVDALTADREKLPKLKEAIISVLQQYEYAKPGFSDILRKDIEEEKHNFSKFILRPDNTGGYTLVYPMHGDPLLPEDHEKEDEVTLQIPAGRMPTREILHAVHGDVRNSGGYRVPSYTSPKFTRQVVDRMAKLFAQAHMAAKKQVGKQLSFPLQEQQEEGRGITTKDIQDYIAAGFTLALADVTYIKGSGRSGGSGRADFTPPTGVPRQTTLAIVRFVLDDEPHEDLSYDQTEELFKAAINFVKMLDEDISLLGDEVTGVLQSLTHKEEGSFASKGAEIKELLNKYAEIGTRIDDELDALVMKWKDDADKGNLPGIQNLLTPDQLIRGPGGIGPSEPRRHYYRGQVGSAFEGTIMEQYVDDRLDLLDQVGRQARLLRTYVNPDDWSKFTDEIKARHVEAIGKITDSYSALQTVEELSKLFESAPNLVYIIREEIEAVLYG